MDRILFFFLFFNLNSMFPLESTSIDKANVFPDGIGFMFVEIILEVKYPHLNAIFVQFVIACDVYLLRNRRH